MKDEDGDEEELSTEGAKVYRGLAARLNFMSQDCPDQQFPIRPAVGRWRNPFEYRGDI